MEESPLLANATKEEEIEMMQPRAKEWQEPPKFRRVKTYSPLSLQMQQSPADSWIVAQEN